MQILLDLKKCTSQVLSSVFINQPRYYVKDLIIGFVIKMVFKHTHSILGFLLFQIFYSRYGNSIIALYSYRVFFFAPQNIEKLLSKVAHNPTRPPVLSPASFFFVKLRQF